MATRRHRMEPVSSANGGSRLDRAASFLRHAGGHPSFRLFVFSLASTLWLALILLRLWDLQVRQADRLIEKAHRQHEGVIEVHAARGAIYDRFGEELALSTPVDSIGVIPSKVRNPELAAGLLAEVLRMDPEAVLAKLKQERFQWIKRLAEPGEAERVRQLGLQGIHFEKESKRYYPKGTVASHVLGAVGVDHEGLAGLEQSFEKILKGEPGRRLVQHDALLNRYASHTLQEPTPGASLALTIDQRIQGAAERELALAIRETRAAGGTITIMDPHTGDLLALASWPTFDPNLPVRSRKDLERRRNFAISNLIEPGSTFKLVTIAAGIEENVVTAQETLDCQMGGMYMGARYIRDHKPFGILSVADVLAKSSNVGAIKVGMRLEPERLYKYIRRFGFGSRTGLPLPGEIDGLLRPVSDWQSTSLGSISIGHEIGVTAVQLARAVSVIANGGFLVQPRIVEALIEPDGTRKRMDSAPAVRVLSSTTAVTMRGMMEHVVLEGTGMLAQTPGYRVGGKTGTAQKVDPETGAYSHTDYVPSFVGFAPVNDPSIVAVIVLDSPVGKYYGGQVAAPVFPRVATRALRYRDVPAELPLGPDKPLRRPPAEAIPEAMLADFSEPLPGRDLSLSPAGFHKGSDGTFIIAPLDPNPGALGPRGKAGFSPAAGEEVSLRIADTALPDFRGRSVRQVLAQTTALGLRLDVRGEGLAWRQWPGPATPVRRGQTVTVEFTKSRRGVVGAKAAR